MLISSGLLPDVEEQMRSYGVGLAGQLAFNGNIRGSLNDPNLNGRFSVGTLTVNGNELGALAASIAMNDQEIRIPDGRLSERDGGGVQFSLIKPRTGENNMSIEATLDRFSARNLLALSPLSKELTSDTESDISGQIKAGIPDAMIGSAELRFGPGRLGGEALESMVARATFNGPNVNIETVDVRLGAGHIVAKGNFNTQSRAFDFRGHENIQSARLSRAFKKARLPAITGVGNFTGQITGSLKEEDFSNYRVTFDGEGRDVTINGRSAGTIALSGRTENQQLNITLTSGLLGPPQVVARINLASPSLASSLETTFTNADLTNLFQIVMPGSAVRLSGRVNGTIKAEGNLLDEDQNFHWPDCQHSKLHRARVSALKTFNSALRRLWLFVSLQTRSRSTAPGSQDQAQTSCSTARWQRLPEAGRA